MRFAKLHGLGNDFLLIDRRGPSEGDAPDAAAARLLCDRHRGVGGDGVLTLLPGETPGSARLVIHNADGSRAEMCGNGARVAALWIATDGCTRPGSGRVLLHTDAGPRPCAVEAGVPGMGEIEVGMGRPMLGARLWLPLAGKATAALPVSMGNPHRVFLLGEGTPDSAAELLALVAREGPALCTAGDANIEMVRRLGPQRFVAAVWERGAGLTQACGTGACAVAAAAVEEGAADPSLPITVQLPGGPLHLRFQEGQVMMRGPAQLVFRGELLL